MLGLRDVGGWCGGVGEVGGGGGEDGEERRRGGRDAGQGKRGGWCEGEGGGEGEGGIGDNELGGGVGVLERDKKIVANSDSSFCFANGYR